MVSVTSTCTDQIGEAAGQIWHCLEDNGRMSLAKLAKAVDMPRDVVMQGVGWLCEGKVEIEETNRGRVIFLTEYY